MKIKSLILLILQLVCLPAIANNSVEKIKEQYVNYMQKCLSGSLIQNNPKKARAYCTKAIEVGDIPEIKNITTPYLFKSLITLMYTDELNKKGKNKTIFESTYKDLTKVIDNTDSVGQKSQASMFRFKTELLHHKYHKNKFLGNNLCSDIRSGLSHKMGRQYTQILMSFEINKKIIKKECT